MKERKWTFRTSAAQGNREVTVNAKTQELAERDARNTLDHRLSKAGVRTKIEWKLSLIYPKIPQQVWLVEDSHNAPGRIYAVLHDEEDAIAFAELLNEPCNVVPRTLFYGQPPNRGYNE